MAVVAAGRTYVCHLDDLNDPDGRGSTLSLGEQSYDVFVVRQGLQVFGYLNSCPHTGSPLDWVPEQFLSLDKRYIQCATHDALFRLNDGYCIAGPCAGSRLTPVPVVVTGGEVVILHGDFAAGGYCDAKL
jgi:nitrite reductase/ring-hydroxylating ferredoxin subunit